MWVKLYAISVESSGYVRGMIEDTSSPPVVPDSFMGGSAPRLRSLHLNRIPFPGLPKLLSSANGLVHLYLSNTLHSGHILPDALATCLSALTSLKDLAFEFQSPRSRPDRVSRRLPPPMHRSLLALTRFSFKSVSEYLEDFVTRIDTPQLDRLSITLFNQHSTSFTVHQSYTALPVTR